MMHFSPPPRTVGTVKGGGGVTTFPTLQRTSPMKSFGNHIRFTGNLANCTTSGAKTVILQQRLLQSSIQFTQAKEKKKLIPEPLSRRTFFPSPNNTPSRSAQAQRHSPLGRTVSTALAGPLSHRSHTLGTRKSRPNSRFFPSDADDDERTGLGQKAKMAAHTKTALASLSDEGCFFFLACLLVLCCDACHSVRAVKLCRNVKNDSVFKFPSQFNINSETEFAYDSS